MNRIYTQVLIIGAGPAGCAAAIQLKRSGIDNLLFEKDHVGGLAINANLIENYLGFPKGINGKEFVKLLENHLLNLEIRLIREEIINISWNSEKELFYANSKINYYKSDYLIDASGTIPKKISINNEKKLEELEYIYYEPSKLDKEKIKNKKIAIIGAGDVAFDYALQLVKYVSELTIINRKSTFSCLPPLLNRVKSNDNKIKIINNKHIVSFEIIKNRNKSYVEIEFIDNSKFKFDIIIIAIGRVVNDSLIKQLEIERKELKKLFQIGDVKNGYYRQISIASADGIKCAMKIANDFKINSDSNMF